MEGDKRSLEEVYGISKNPVKLERWTTTGGKTLETFESPVKAESRPMGSEGLLSQIMEDEQRYSVELPFPEFTCRCPRTGHPDFATIIIRYKPRDRCVEMKSLKYYLNSFRDEGHFHEQVCNLIYDDLVGVLDPIEIQVEGRFNSRGGISPVIKIGEWPRLYAEGEV